MNLQTITTDEEYEEMLVWVDNQFDSGILPESEQGCRVETALLLIKQYEELHYSVPNPADTK